MTSYMALAWRNVLRHRRRSLPPLAAICMGMVALILAAGFIEWGLWFGRESTIRSGLGHIRLYSPGYRESGVADPFRYLLSQDMPSLREIERLKGVQVVAPRLAFNGLISRGETTISFLGEGVAPEKERILSNSVSITRGRNLDEADTHGVILGQGLAENLGVNPGDTVVLLANTSTRGINGVEVRVRGLFATITKAYDDSALRVPIELAHKLLKVSGAHSYAVLLDKTENTDLVLASMRRRFANEQLELVSWRELSDFYRKTAELFSRQMAVVRALIAAIIVLSISNSMIMAVMERTSEIGTTMALGSRRSGILKLFLWEGVLLGLIGGVAGLVAGSLAANLISAIGVPMPPAPGMASGYTAEVRVTGAIALQAFSIAVATAFVASLYPAWKAARMQIVDALRHNR